MNRRTSDRYKAVFIGGIAFIALGHALTPRPHDDATDFIFAVAGMLAAAAIMNDASPAQAGKE